MEPVLTAILLTRPFEAACAFEKKLRAATGVGALISPLMQIVPRTTKPDLAGVTAIIFTSQYGVEAFRQLDNPSRLPCFAVGPSTADRARAAGLDVVRGGGTAETLINAVAQSGLKGPMLHVRGAYARGDIAEKLTDCGVKTKEWIAYQQKLDDLTDEAKTLLSRETPVIVPLFSQRTAAQFLKVSKATAPLTLVFISQVVADEVAHLAAHEHIIAQTPDGAGMINAITAVLP